MIAYVEVYLDAPENTPGIYRIHSVTSYDINDKEIKNYPTLAYSCEFNDNDGGFRQEIIEYVAIRVGVPKEAVGIKGYI